MDPARYLERIGIDPATVETPDFETLERLQRAHVTSVPFENLAITGDPYGAFEREGVSLALPDLYEKVVERRRGGFCFELNGLFGWLLAELGFDADRVAARVGGDGDFGPPANHHTHVVTLDRRYVVDVGMGTPVLRRPVPLGGALPPDEAGVEWRHVESDRPDADYLTQYRGHDAEEWTDRYVFETTPRKLSYFEATCDHLATAPESGFTGDSFVSVATDDGHAKLKPEAYTRWVGGERTETPVDESAWYDRLEREFGLQFSET